MKVDRSVTLQDILHLPDDWQTQHKIRALAVGDRCPAQDGLVELKREHTEDYKKIRKVMLLLGTSDRVRNELHVKRGTQHRDVYEMRGGNARLFFFYTPDTEEIVVCLNLYQKRKSSSSEQNEVFAIADRLRQLYLSSRKEARKK
ncbi:MAG: hypothetical protein IT368_03335 [Candidatus Hydrogenedentes bacterium]|nr:hypothetical protein [Candidatus Hydrogenedentota bacterium]